MSTPQRQATVQRLDEIGEWVLVAGAWKHLDTRRMIYELAHLAQLVVRCHNELATPNDQISFDDPEAIWIVEIMSALREFRPTAFSPE